MAYQLVPSAKAINTNVFSATKAADIKEKDEQARGSRRERARLTAALSMGIVEIQELTLTTGRGGGSFVGSDE